MCSAAIKAAVERAIAVSDRNATIMSVPVLMSIGDGNLNVKVHGRQGQLAARSGSVRSTQSVPVEIGRGENRGRTVTYHNVVRRWLKLGDFTGSGPSLGACRSPNIIAGDIDGCRGHGAGKARATSRASILGAALAPIGDRQLKRARRRWRH